MTDFLTFLNTADLQTLTKIPGVSRTIAGNIIAARPFDFVEDCAKVDKVGKNLLGRMQSFYEAELYDSRNSAMVPVSESRPSLIERDRSAADSHEERPSFGTRFGNAFGAFIRALLKLVLIVVLIGGIGYGLYYSLPYIRRSLIEPVERNTARVDALEGEVARLQSQVEDMNTRVDSIATAVSDQTASLQKLEAMQSSLENDLDQHNDKVLLEMKHEVMMTRALEMLGRARLYLAQSNYGLAREDVRAARDLLSELQAETEDPLLTDVINRLDLALGNLPLFPVVASGDLEIAWQTLMSAVSPESGTAAPLPSITPTPSASPTGTSTPEAAPTVNSTATP